MMAGPLGDAVLGCLHRVVNGIALALAIIIALLPPLFYEMMARAAVRSEVEVESRFVAAAISDIAARNPDHWSFEGPRIEHALRQATDEWHAFEIRIVYEASGTEVGRIGDSAPWPVMRRESAIIAHGQRVGSVVVDKSLRPIAAMTLVIGVLSMILTALVFVLLRRAPKRLLDIALQRVTHLSSHDLLTGLPNRVLLLDRLNQALAFVRREPGMSVAVMCLDIRRLREVNEAYGNDMGDRLLREVAQRLRAQLRDTDTLARVGGDDFAVILPRANHPHSAEMIAQRLINVLNEPFCLMDHEVSVAASIGIALASGPDDALSEALLSDAELARDAAKREGRGAICFFAPEMNVALRRRQAIEADLRAALARAEFELHYQPQVSLASGRMVGVEALIRWRHPERGLVMPDEFVPLAEEIGLLPQIGAWVVQEACRQAVRWEGLKVAVNVSASQIHAGGLETMVARALAETGLPAARLEIEITEGVLLTKTEGTFATLKQLRALGVAIAMDDFGTGYSSLGYLQRFRFDKIKIDRSFITHLDDDANSVAIVEAVLGIANALGVRANAEGVENGDQARMLAQRGCDEAQGWLFGRPMTAEAITALLAEAGRREVVTPSWSRAQAGGVT